MRAHPGWGCLACSLAAAWLYGFESSEYIETVITGRTLAFSKINVRRSPPVAWWPTKHKLLRGKYAILCSTRRDDQRAHICQQMRCSLTWCRNGCNWVAISFQALCSANFIRILFLFSLSDEEEIFLNIVLYFANFFFIFSLVLDKNTRYETGGGNE